MTHLCKMPLTALPLGLLWGAALGLFFFGGLWLTIRKLPGSKHPHLLWFCSLLLRLAVLLAGIFPLLRWGTIAWLGALAGIVLAKAYLARRLKPARGRG